MGDLRDWSPESDAALLEERPISSSNPASVGLERWEIAEQATQGIISQVQPTVVSEERRRAVIDYVQRLIKGYIGCEVFPFGSVPLKTYLPDGDIDLTAFGVPNVVDSLVSDVSSVLEGEEQNSDAEFVVKDVQVINAEVKLVKCLVQNIVVDISFNQLGGLCTLCFLEQVDRLIGKDHLFKRSIILTKAWCYYESRILGAHHGLISTYALETLVLYIFHLFHSSLNGPLEVLYRFLDYFSKFDWDNYCISVNGPVRLSSLPEIVAERPDNGGLDLLLSNEFLRECVDVFSVPVRGHEMSSRTFLQKHLNIVDPLKENNNLGRSISKGNSYRIRSAFTYGARKLGRILLQPDENVSEELLKFFMNTLDRHGSGQRPDVQDSFARSCFNGYGPAMAIERCQEDKMVSMSAESRGINGESKSKFEELLENGMTKVKVSATEDEFQNGSSKEGATSPSEGDSFTKGSTVSASRLSGDAKDLATLRISSLRISEDMPKYYSSGGEDAGTSFVGKAHHAPHLYSSHSSMGNAKISNGDLDGLASNGSDENHLTRNNSSGSTNSPPVFSSIASFSKDFYPCHLERARAGPTASPEAVKAILDLSGEYDAHYQSLQYGRWCYEYALSAPEYALSAPISPVALKLPSQFQSNNSWNPVRRLSQVRRGAYSQVSANGVVPRPAAFFPVNLPPMPGSPFTMEESPKPRGTGTYFPNMNHQLNRAKLSPSRVKNNAPVRSPRTNGRAYAPMEGSREGSPAQYSLHQGGVNAKDLPNTNGVLHSDDKAVEFGSFGQLQQGGAPPVVGSSRSPVMQSSSLSSPTRGMQREKPIFADNEDRVASQLYHLKDEEDFPPLST